MVLRVVLSQLRCHVQVRRLVTPEVVKVPYLPTNYNPVPSYPTPYHPMLYQPTCCGMHGSELGYGATQVAKDHYQCDTLTGTIPYTRPLRDVRY
eukprot:1872107-Rhodomonas_salina.1